MAENTGSGIQASVTANVRLTDETKAFLAILVGGGIILWKKLKSRG